MEVRGEADAPRLYLRAIATGEQAGDRLEVFDALPTQPEGGVLVGRLHPASKAPVLRAQLEERDGALILDCEIPDTTAGRDLALEVRSGLLPMASIEFRALADRVVGGVRRISEVNRRGRVIGPGRLLPKRDRRSSTPAPAPRAVVSGDARRYRDPSDRGG